MEMKRFNEVYVQDVMGDETSISRHYKKEVKGTSDLLKMLTTAIEAGISLGADKEMLLNFMEQVKELNPGIVNTEVWTNLINKI